MSVATQILAKVEAKRWQRAVEGWASSSSVVTVTRLSETEVRGLVARDGKEYGVTLAEGRSWCSCRDHLYRGGVCRHMLTLALQVMRPLGQAR